MRHNYQIIITSKNRQLEFIKGFDSEEKANKYFNKLLNENKNIVFPVRYINTTKIEEAKYELVIIKRKKNDSDNNVTKLRNQYGEFVPHVTNNENWIIYDKAPYDKEETFWVYGYHPLVQRKDFLFIFNNLIKEKCKSKNDFMQISIFKNKLLFEKFDNLDLVICKNKSDCIRLYNQLEEWCKKNKKIKYILFNGESNTKLQRQYAIQKIQKLTNWNLLKINRCNTRP